MKSKIREHRGARVAGGETEPYLPPVPLYMPESGWSEWLARLSRNVNVLGNAASSGAPGAGAGSTGGATISATPPPSPTVGQLWWDSSVGGGQLFTWYSDPNSSQWVIANSITGGEITGDIVMDCGNF